MLETKVQEAWRVLRIQSELVDGTDRLLKLGRAITVFGGARFDQHSEHYEAARIWVVSRARGFTGNYWRRSRYYGGGESRLSGHRLGIGWFKH